jgi:hypothetical protein
LLGSSFSGVAFALPAAHVPSFVPVVPTPPAAFVESADVESAPVPGISATPHAMRADEMRRVTRIRTREIGTSLGPTVDTLKKREMQRRKT